MSNPNSGLKEDVYEGWRWPAFLFGPFWYAAKGLYVMALVSIIVALCTFGLSWLIFPAFASKQHREHLASAGYTFTPRTFES